LRHAVRTVFDGQLGQARHPRDEHVFVLGCAPGTALSVFQQQEQAVVFAAALLNERDQGRVAIIGGGVAGLTAAAILALGGREVALFEAAPVLLPTLLNGAHRYIHPNIAKWPRVGWHENKAWAPNPDSKEDPLAWLEWQAGPAPRVAQQISEGFSSVRSSMRGRLEVLTGARVSGRPADGSKAGPLVWDFEQIKRRFGTVILATGLGVDGVPRGDEPFTKGDDTVPYWEPDPLHSIERLDREPCRVLVGGNGDGGLTEVARATIAGYHHEQLVEAISRRAIFRGVAEMMDRAELEAGADQKSKKSTVIAPEFYYRQDQDLWRYVSQELGRLIRWNHTRVDWVAEGVRVQGTQMFNRFVVLAIIRAGRAEFVAGRVKQIYRGATAKMVELERPSEGDCPGVCRGPYAAVCVRGGPRGRGSQPLRASLPRRLRKGASRMRPPRRLDEGTVTNAVVWLRAALRAR
jgi:Pyridine nucleotide-disulphide oxidoreductase